MPTLLAALPLATPLFWLLVLRRSPITAGALGLLVAFALSALPNGPFSLTPGPLALALLYGLLLTLLVGYVVFGGLLLYHVMRLGGALDIIARTVATLSPHPAAQTLLLTLGLAPFLESVSGFGVGVVVTAPLLLALGTGSAAPVVGLLGLNTVPWGALAIGSIIAAELGGVSVADVGKGSALLTAPLLPYYGAVAVLLIGGWRSLRCEALLLILMSGTLALSLWLVSHITVELAGALGGLASTIVGVFALRVRAGARVAGEKRPAVRDIGRAFLPYLALVAALLATRLIPPITRLLQSTVRLDVPQVGFSLPLLYSPGFWLIASAGLAAWLFGLRRAAFSDALRHTWTQWRMAALSMALFLMLSQVMTQAGMIAHLAETLARAAGPAYLLVAPLIGGLGGFLTGSNAGSNSLFAPLQAEAARRMDLAVAPVIAAQNAAGSHLTMASPSRVILATTVAGRRGDEGSVMRIVLLVNLGALLLMMLTLLAWSAWGS